MKETRRKIAMKWISATVVVLIWAVAIDFFGYRDYRYFDEILGVCPLTCFALEISTEIV